MSRVESLLVLQVVSNSVNGLDVDKADYLARDALMVGLHRQLDCSHIAPLFTQYSRVSVAILTNYDSIAGCLLLCCQLGAYVTLRCLPDAYVLLCNVT